MELKGMTQKAVDAAEKIDTNLSASAARRQELETAANLKRGIEDRRRPLSEFAAKLLSISPDKEFHWANYSQFQTSPLIKVGNLEDGKELYVAVRKVYESDTHDADRYPTWEAKSFNRWEFIGAVAVKKGEGTFSSSHEGDDRSIVHLGKDLNNEGVFGSIISTERLRKEISGDFLTVESAQKAVGTNSKELGSIEETVELIRQSIADENLNPKDKIQLTPSLV